MKFSVEKSVIVKAISSASRIVEKRNTIPILANVLIVAQGNELTLTSTDLDLELRQTIAADTAVGGAITVPAGLMNDIVRKMGGEVIDFELKEADGLMHIGSGRSKFKLHCLPMSDFPTLTAGAFKNSFSMPAADLHKLFNSTSFAISTEETRYYLNGIFLHFKDINGVDSLCATATDGHRLAFCRTDGPDGAAGMPGIIVPRKAVSEMDKILDSGPKEIHVSLSDSKIQLTVGNVTMTSKLIDGTFPDYERVVPKGNNIIAVADKKGLSLAADRVSTVASDKGKAIKMSFENTTLTLLVNSPDNGAAEEQMPVDFDSDKIEMGFNVKYLQDILANIGGESARIELADAGSPALIRDPAVADSYFVLMPMRI